jgi:alpha-1,6-mannosyltransferase
VTAAHLGPQRRTLAVAGLGAALIALTYAVHLSTDLVVDSVRYVTLAAGMLAISSAAAILLWRRARRRDVVIVLAVALACRLLVVADMPTLSDDAYRFVWDGRVQAAGINPYAHAPASPSLLALRDYRIFPEVNRPHTRTGYPPANEVALYAVNRVAGDGTTQVKLAFVAVEAAAIALLLLLIARAGMSLGRVALYAWHPLAIFEIAGTGHPEPLLVALTLGALLAWDRRASVTAGAALGAAILTKFAPLLLAPFMVRRLGPRFLAAAAVAAGLLLAPYLGAGTGALGSVGAFQHERFGAGPHRWLVAAGVADRPARALLLAALALGVAYSAARPPRDLVAGCRYAALLLAGALLASFSVQPWYLLWILPLMCVAPVGGLLWAAGSVSAYYLAIEPYQHLDQDLISVIVWGPTVALLGADALRAWASQRTRRDQPPVVVPSS